MDVEAGPIQRIGMSGAIGGWVYIVNGNDTIIAWRDLPTLSAAKRSVVRHTATNYGTSLTELTQRPTCRVGWGRLPDDSEVIGFYDIADDNFGYAVNLTYDEGEWGYQWFGTGKEA